jgi:hypothetical protein
LEQNPDFAILTEVENIQALNALATHQLQGRYRPLLKEGNDIRGIDIGFLVRTNLPWHTNLVSHKEIQFTDPMTGHTAPLFSRDLPVLEIRRKPDDPKPLLVLVGNHAKSKRSMDGDFESTRWRTAQYEEAAKIIQTDYQSQGIPVIMAGDFNTDVRFDPEVAPVKSILKSSLEIAPDALPVDQRVTHTYFPRGSKQQPDPPPERSQMDDILVSPGITVLSAQIIKYKNPDGTERTLPRSYKERSEQPSDHNPVRAVISTEGLF